MSNMPNTPDAITMLVYLLLVLAAVVLLAHLRDGLVALCHAAIEIIARIFVIPARAIERVRPPLDASIQAVFAGIRYGANAAPAVTWIGWEIIGPLVYLLSFMIISAGDYYFAVLGFAAMLGVDVGPGAQLPISPEMASGLLFVALASFFGFVLLDLHGGTPVHRPWSNFTGRAHRTLQILATAGVVMSILAGISFYVWRELQLLSEPPEPLSTLLTVFLWTLLGVLLVLASAMAGWAVAACLGSLYALVLLVVRLALLTILAALHGPVYMLRFAMRALTALIDIPAGWGAALWNWFCGFQVASRLNLQRLTPKQFPDIGDDIGQPLFP